jgi:SprT-like family protein
MRTINTLAELDRMCAEAVAFELQTFTVQIPFHRLPSTSPLGIGFSIALQLIQKYQLPCDVGIRELSANALARHGYRRDGTCAIELSKKLTDVGDQTSIRRAIIHEIAHRIAGRGHGHDESFRRIASDLYEREGYPRGSRGDHHGNIC